MARSYHYPCSHCQQTIKLSVVQAGQDTCCPKCDQPITVPKLGELRQFEAVEEPAAPGSQSAGSSLKRFLFTTGLAVAVLLGAAGGVLYNYASDLDIEFDLESLLATENQAIDELSPVELLDYHEKLFEQGLGEWQEQAITQFQKRSSILKQLSFGLFGLSAIGVLMVAGSFFDERFLISDYLTTVKPSIQFDICIVTPIFHNGQIK